MSLCPVRVVRGSRRRARLRHRHPLWMQQTPAYSQVTYPSKHLTFLRLLRNAPAEPLVSDVSRYLPVYVLLGAGPPVPFLWDRTSAHRGALAASTGRQQLIHRPIIPASYLLGRGTSCSDNYIAGSFAWVKQLSLFRDRARQPAYPGRLRFHLALP